MLFKYEERTVWLLRLASDNGMPEPEICSLVMTVKMPQDNKMVIEIVSDEKLREPNLVKCQYHFFLKEIQ